MTSPILPQFNIIPQRAHVRHAMLGQILAELQKPLQALTALKTFLESAQSDPQTPTQAEQFYDLKGHVGVAFSGWFTVANCRQFNALTWAITGVDDFGIYLSRHPEFWDDEFWVREITTYIPPTDYLRLLSDMGHEGLEGGAA